MPSALDLDEHRKSMVARFLLLRAFDADYCKAQLAVYERKLGEGIGAQVAAAWPDYHRRGLPWSR